MLSLNRFILPVILGLAVAGAAQAQTLSSSDAAATRAAVAAAQAGDWNRASADVAAISDPLPLKMLRWLNYASPGAPGRFADIADFIEKNPAWPRQKALRMHAEEALAGETDAVAAAWFARFPPISATGQIRAAEIKLKSGDVAGGTAALRAVWVDSDFNAIDEKSFLASHGAAITPARRSKPARPAAVGRQGRGGAADAVAGAAGLPRVGRGASRLVAACARRPTCSLHACRRRCRRIPVCSMQNCAARREKDMTDAAVAILRGNSGDPLHPEAWWRERQIIARRVLAGGNFDLAYQIAAQHGVLDGKAYADANFLLGYIALRFKKDPALAFDDFSHILTRADTPYAKARAAYWGGRAAEAEAKPDLARKWYAAGAEHMATFYGQLAAHQLGDDAPPKPVPEPVPTSAERAAFDSDEVVRATEIFFAIGDRQHSKDFLMHLADQAQTPTQFSMLATLAEQNGRLDLGSRSRSARSSPAHR